MENEQQISLSQQENIKPPQENIKPPASFQGFQPKKRKQELPCQLNKSPYKLLKGQNGENQLVEKKNSAVNIKQTKSRINRFENLQSHKKTTKPTLKPLSEQTLNFWNSRQGYKTEKSLSANKKSEVTRPRSPSFSTNSRSQLRSERKRKEILEEQNSAHKAQRTHEPGVIPNYRLFEPKKVGHNPIQFKEFALQSEIRGQQKKQELEGKLQDQFEQEQKLKQFQAQPIPEYRQLSAQGINSSVIKKEITLPKEFKFSTNDRSQLYSRSSIQEDNSYKFQARPMPDMRQRTPSKPPVRPTTKSVSPLLKSETRAGDRRKFDVSVKEKQEEYNKFKQEQKEESDDEQVRLFKSTGIRKYREFQIQKSNIKLTEPKAPTFKTDERINKKHQKLETDTNRSQASDPTQDTSEQQQQLIEQQEIDEVNQQKEQIAEQKQQEEEVV